MGESFIVLKGLRKEFGELVAVEDLELEVQEGEFLCFLGPSGCGKTTTLRMIAGLEIPTTGDIFLRGERINDLPPQRRNVGFVFQNYALFWHMTVRANLAFGLMVRGAPRSEIEREVGEMARWLELEDLLSTKASRLDLSAMQRVALGRTLVTRPQVLLLDEPLNNFRPGLREIMRGELKRLQKQLGSTMIYVTHDQEEAMTMGDRILVMSAGRKVQLATPRELYRQPNSLFVAGFIGRPPMNLLEVTYAREGDRAFLRKGELAWDVTSLRSTIEGGVRGERAVLGVRPEHVLPVEEAERPGLEDTVVTGKVDLVQPLARRKIVDLSIDDTLIKMVVSSDFPVAKDDRVGVVFHPQAMHLFDKETERAICNGFS